MLRHLGQRQRAGRRHDALFVDLDALEPRDVRASGDDDGFGFQRLGLAVVAFDFDLAGRGDTAGAMEGVDLVLLEQELDALGVALDTLILEVQHRFQVELRLADADAHLAEGVSGFLEQFGGVQQCLRRNAADIETRAAEGGPFFDHRGFQAQLRRANGADIAAGAGADNDEIVSSHETITYRSSCRAFPGHPRLKRNTKKGRRGCPAQGRP